MPPTPTSLETPDTRRDLVVFDFDGTLTTEDTFVLFMKHYRGTADWLARMVPLLPTFLRYKLGRIDRHAVKHAVVGAVFTGEPMDAIEAKAKAFARDAIPDLIRPDGMVRFRERVDAMRAGGPQVVICSASISPYLRAYFAPYPDVEIVACELESDSTDSCTGKLRSRNVWGENKLIELRERFRSDTIHLVETYGDTAGDRAILEAAETAFWRPFRV